MTPCQTANKMGGRQRGCNCGRLRAIQGLVEGRKPGMPWGSEHRGSRFPGAGLSAGARRTPRSPPGGGVWDIVTGLTQLSQPDGPNRSTLGSDHRMFSPGPQASSHKENYFKESRANTPSLSVQRCPGLRSSVESTHY